MLNRILLLVVFTALTIVSPVLAQDGSNVLTDNRNAVEGGFSWWWLVPLVILIPFLLMRQDDDSTEEPDEYTERDYFGSPVTYSEIRKRRNREREKYE